MVPMSLSQAQRRQNANDLTGFSRETEVRQSAQSEGGVSGQRGGPAPFCVPAGCDPRVRRLRAHRLTSRSLRFVCVSSMTHSLKFSRRGPLAGDALCARPPPTARAGSPGPVAGPGSEAGAAGYLIVWASLKLRLHSLLTSSSHSPDRHYLKGEGSYEKAGLPEPGPTDFPPQPPMHLKAFWRGAERGGGPGSPVWVRRPL